MSNKVTTLGMDTITKKSGHTLVPNAVSVCITPAAPSPLPIPYPVVAQTSEGITDPPMRTKINGADIMTVGSVAKACHGNEPGTLKEVVSLNTAGPCFLTVAAPNVYCELGMLGMTGALAFQNKQITVGAPAMATGAGGAGSTAGTGSGSGSPNADDDKSKDPNNNGGDGGDGNNTGATAPTAGPGEDIYCPDYSQKAPKDFLPHIEASDLRQHRDKVEKFGNPVGKEAAKAAMDGQEGGEAFWSGEKTGLAKLREKGFKAQEDAVDKDGNADGANKLGTMQKENQLPHYKETKKDPVTNQEILGPDGKPQLVEMGEGSKVTNTILWTTISRRSAQNAKGDVQAFVVGTAASGNIFSSIELPTLLHNDKVDKVVFHDPEGPPPDPVEWNRSKEDGCWRGKPTTARGDKPGFKLHPTQGFERKPDAPNPAPPKK